MIVYNTISIPDKQLAELCRRYHVREMALFGSVLRDDFRDDSDIDVLVVYEPTASVSYFDMSAPAHELEQLFGRSVDLGTGDSLKPLIRDDVLASSIVIYDGDFSMKEIN